MCVGELICFCGDKTPPKQKTENFIPKQKNEENVPTNCFLSVDGKTPKNSPSVYSFRDHICKAFGKTLTQSHSRIDHERYACKKQETEKRSKEKCFKCGKFLFKPSIYRHAKNGCPTQKRGVADEYELP